MGVKEKTLIALYTRLFQNVVEKLDLGSSALLCTNCMVLDKSPHLSEPQLTASQGGKGLVSGYVLQQGRGQKRCGCCLIHNDHDKLQ